MIVIRATVGRGARRTCGPSAAQTRPPWPASPTSCSTAPTRRRSPGSGRPCSTATHVAPYDDAELARLRAQGIDDPEDDPSVLVESAPGLPRLWFQRVPEPKVVKNRVHLDVRADDVAAEVARLVALGATASTTRPIGDLVVLRDPEGNELCVID